MRAVIRLGALAVLAAGCSHSAQPPAEPAPAAAPQPAPAAAPAARAPAAADPLLGEWRVTLNIGSTSGTSQMRITARSGGGYMAVMQSPTGGGPGYRSRSVTMNGGRVTIIFLNPEPSGEDARWDATFRSANVLEGIFVQGTATGRLTARRQ